MFGDLENSAFGFVTISKLLFYLHAFTLKIFSMFLVCASYGEYLFKCSFFKPFVYICTNSEQHLIHICLYFIAHLYSLHAHV